MEDDQHRDFLAYWAKAFRVGTDANKIRNVLASYLSCVKNGLSQGELIDFLCISSPSILDLAGADSRLQELVLELLTEITDEEIQSASRTG